MRRGRSNRRKAEPLRLPKLPELPKVRVRWRAILTPMAVIAVLIVAGGAARVLLDRPVRSLIIEGTFQRVTAVQIEAALDAAHGQSFFSLDLDELKDAVTAIDWVDTVELSRVWPGALRVRVTEHQAAASWGEKGLLDTRGELFTEDARYKYAELPKLAGPEGSEHRVASLYLEVRPRLAEVNLMLESLSMDARGALEIRLAGGQEIRLGRQDLNERLDRFFAVVAPVLAGELEQVEYVDLRYPNGFAVGWREVEPAEEVRLAEVDSGG